MGWGRQISGGARHCPVLTIRQQHDDVIGQAWGGPGHEREAATGERVGGIHDGDRVLRLVTQ